MRNAMKLLGIVTMTLLVSGCASLAEEGPIALELRELELSRTVPGFEYRWEECTRKGIFRKDCQLKVEYYDVRDKAVLDKLENMGFIGVRRDLIVK